MTLLYLVRHGRSVWNSAGRIQGQIDIELDETGLRQAERIAERLSDEPLKAIYSSPLLRAKATAEAIAARCNLPIMLDTRLMEYDFGVVSGMTWADIEEHYPELANRWLEDPWAVALEGSEGRANFARRVMAAIEEIDAQYPVGPVVVVAHGGTFGVYLTAMLGLDLNRRHPFHFGNTSLSLVEVDDGVFHIHYLNNTCHLS
jgi:broad specificity phosphatase PhoE